MDVACCTAAEGWFYGLCCLLVLLQGLDMLEALIGTDSFTDFSQEVSTPQVITTVPLVIYKYRYKRNDYLSSARETNTKINEEPLCVVLFHYF